MACSPQQRLLESENAKISQFPPLLRVGLSRILVAFHFERYAKVRLTLGKLRHLFFWAWYMIAKTH